MYENLLDLGAGSELQRWETGRAPGVHGADYVEYAANYILMGYGVSGYGRGIEVYDERETAQRHDANGEVINSTFTNLAATFVNPSPAPRKPHPAPVG